MSNGGVKTEAGHVKIRQVEVDDIPALVRLNKLCFPSMAEENVVWAPSHLASHIRLFPQGQLLAELDGRVVGAISSLIVEMGSDPLRPHTYAGITDGGFFYNHNPQGDTLYGADVYVHPEVQGKGVGHLLYQARRDLCRKLNLRRILAGGRISGYAPHRNKITAEEYVRRVENGDLKDPVLSFQLREGFVVRGILRNYITDPQSDNCASLIEWLNPDFRESDHSRGLGKVRVGCVQYQVRKIENFDDFADQVDYFVETASDYRVDFLVFPEFFSVQLLSQRDLRKLPAMEGIRRLAGLEKQFMDLMASMARDYGIHIVGGSHPMIRGDKMYNVSPFFAPDGEVILQPKIHITPAEKKFWGVDGGSQLQVISTPKARIGITICYDVEFPETARYLADHGAEILFVPYCTDDRQGYLRVRYCAQARAIENQMYVVTSGIIGNLPSVPAMDIHYGRAGIFTPSDFEFARDGIQAEADSNVEMLLVSDLDINDLYRSQTAGSVTPKLDRRRDLFQFTHNIPDPGLDPSQLSAPMKLPPAS